MHRTFSASTPPPAATFIGNPAYPVPSAFEYIGIGTREKGAYLAD